MTLIFGNFPETLGMSGSLENSQTSIFLHRLVCGSPRLKKLLVRSIKIKNNVCRFLVVLLLFLLLFCNFPHPTDMLGGVENCETKKNLHRLGCGTVGLKKFLKPRFSTFGVFTKYRCCNPSK